MARYVDDTHTRYARTLRLTVCLATLLLAGGCATHRAAPAVHSSSAAESSAPTHHAPRERPVFQRGDASYYAQSFTGQQTASGESFDPEALTAAHPTLPLGTRVRVTNAENQRHVTVRINDRGPYADGRIIDLSPAAARRLHMTHDGVTPVALQIISRP